MTAWHCQRTSAALHGDRAGTACTCPGIRDQKGQRRLCQGARRRALEWMPKDGLVLRWGLDLLWMRTVLQEPGKRRAGVSPLPRAVFHLSFKWPLSIRDQEVFSVFNA